MDIASLIIKADSSSVPKAVAGLTDLEKQALRTENANKRLSASTINQSAAMQKAVQNVQRVELAQKRLENQQKQLERTTGGLKNAIEGITTAIKSYAGAFALFQVVRMADDMLLFKARVDLATDSVQEADEAWAALLETGKNTGSLQTGIEIFSRISLVKADIKATNAETLQFTDTVQKLGIVSGASGDALKFGLTQLGQSLSSDIVRAEEFNSIMENIPAVGKAIADQFGISTGQLRRLVIEGQVLSKDVFAAILNATDEANAKFEQMPMTAGRAFGELKIRIMEIIDGFNEASNATGFIVGGLDVVGDALSGIVNIVNGFIYTFKAMFSSIVGGIAETIAQAIEAVQGLINLGVSGVNLFRSDGNKIAKFDVLGGASSENIRQATQEDFNKNLLGAGKSFKGAADDTLGIFGFADKDFETASKVETKTREIATNYADMAKNLSDTNKEAEKHAKQVQKVTEDLEFRNQQMGRSIEDQELFNQLRQANVDIDTVAGQKIRDLVDEYHKLSEEQKQLERIADSLGDAFSKAFEDGITGAEDFKGVLYALAQDIEKLFIQEMVSGPIKKIFSDVLKNGLGSGGGSGGGGFNFGSILSSVGGFFGFAEGGSFRVGGQGGTDSQLVQFMASPNETVSVTRPDQGGAGGGVVNHWTVDNRGASVEAVARMETAIQNINRTVEARALNAVDNQMKRNPQFGRRS